MVEKLWRAVDLVFGVSGRAREAVKAARVTGLSASLLYDSGPELGADDLLPYFRQGSPGESADEVYVIGQRRADTGHLVVYHGTYDARSDTWRHVKGHVPHPRRPDDYWLRLADYGSAVAAASRARP